MCLENFKSCFSLEEIRNIRKRVSESPTPERERDFIKFFEQLRKKAELYSLIMFQRLKLVSFDPKGKYAIIRGQEGKEIRIDLC